MQLKQWKEESSHLMMETQDERSMYVITNESKLFGAASMLYEEPLHKLAVTCISCHQVSMKLLPYQLILVHLMNWRKWFMKSIWTR